MDEQSIGQRVADFDAFYQREFTSIALIAGTTAGDRAMGEDIAQEAFGRAADRWPEVSGFDKPGAWVRRVAINLAIDRRRRRDSEARAIAKLPDVTVVQPVDRAGDPAVWEAVDELPARQRAAVVLHYYEDRPVAEIAEILQVSVSAVTSHLHRARTALSAALEPTEVQP